MSKPIQGHQEQKQPEAEFEGLACWVNVIRKHDQRGGRGGGGEGGGGECVCGVGASEFCGRGVEGVGGGEDVDVGLQCFQHLGPPRWGHFPGLPVGGESGGYLPRAPLGPLPITGFKQGLRALGEWGTGRTFPYSSSRNALGVQCHGGTCRGIKTAPIKRHWRWGEGCTGGWCRVRVRAAFGVRLGFSVLMVRFGDADTQASAARQGARIPFGYHLMAP